MPNWITTAEAVKLTGYHPVTMRKLLLSGKIHGQKWGRDWQVDRKSLMAYVRKVEKMGERRGPKRRA